MQYGNKRAAKTVPLLALCCVPVVVPAQVDTSQWLCESCPFESGHFGTYEAGATTVSDDAARFGNATGYDEEGVYANVDGSGRYASDGFRGLWYIDDLGLDSRSLALEGGRPGSYGFQIEYSELPYRLFDTTRTIFRNDASGVLALPAGWTPAGTTTGFVDLDASLRTRNIGSDRQNLAVGGQWLPSEHLSLNADIRRQTRDGIDMMAGAGYTQSSILPRAIDYQTDIIDLGMQYRTGRGSVRLAYYGSFFDNRNRSLRWETPFAAPAGATQPQMAQEPDNHFQQISLSGIYGFDTWSSSLAFSASFGRGEQNDTLLPYTINPDITSAALPVSSLEGEVDTANYAVTLTARPASLLRLKLALRYDERDNQTAVSDWSRVITDIFESGDTEQNTPYGFERLRLKLRADLRVLEGLQLAAGFDHTDIDRDFQEVAQQTEDAAWGQLRWRPASWVDVRVRGGAETRDVGRYDTTLATNLGQNPLLRKYNLAFRYREFGELSAYLTPLEVPLSGSVTVRAADDSYTESQLGLTASDELQYTAELSWAISPQLSSYLMFGADSIDARQLGSEQAAAADWRALHEDRFDHLGVGFFWQPTSEKLELQLDYTRGDGSTEILVSSESDGDSRLPDLDSSLDSLLFRVRYRWTEKLESTLDLRYERFAADDWALQDVEPDTLPTVLGLGGDPYDYDVWAVGIGIVYRPGSHELALAD